MVNKNKDSKNIYKENSSNSTFFLWHGYKLNAVKKPALVLLLVADVCSWWNKYQKQWIREAWRVYTLQACAAEVAIGEKLSLLEPLHLHYCLVKGTFVQFGRKKMNALMVVYIKIKKQ